MSITPIAGRHFVAGQWLPAGKDTFASRSPANRNEVVGTFPAGTPAIAHDAVAAAKARLPGLAAHQPHSSRRVLRPARTAHRARHRQARRIDGPRVRQDADRMPGRGGRRAAHGAVRLRHRPDADRARSSPRRSPKRTRSSAASRGAWSRSSRRGTSPLRCRSGCSGRRCSKATRPSSSRARTRPAVGQRLVELFVEAGFPAGTINLVHGDGRVGEALVRNPDVSVVLFTGSYDVGRRIQQISADFFDRSVAAEMGGKNAVIVCEDAKFDLAVNAAIISGFKTSGQRCVSASRILVAENAHGRIRQALRGHRKAASRRRSARCRNLRRAGDQRVRKWKRCSVTTTWRSRKGARCWSRAANRPIAA